MSRLSESKFSKRDSFFPDRARQERPMADFAVILSELLKTVGPAVCEQLGRVKGNLLDRAPDAKREVMLLMHALEVRAPQRFLAERTTAARSSLVASLVQRMEDDFGTSRQLAEWAVQTWLNAVERSHGNQQPAAKQAVIDSLTTSPQPHTPVPSSGLLHSIQSLMSRSNSGTAEAKQKLDAGDFVGAIVVLEAMPAGLRDNTMLAEAKQRLAHQQLEQQRVTAAAEARRKFDAGDYVGAITVIEAMPTTMRDSAMLAEAKRLVAVQQQCH